MEEKSCLKCGRPCQPDQAFCPDCLAEMERHPVKPGVVVLLPPREQSRPAVRRRHAPPPLEEQVNRLKRQLLALWLALILALSAAGALGWLVLSEYLEEDDLKPLPGQNYSSETSVGQEENQ